MSEDGETWEIIRAGVSGAIAAGNGGAVVVGANGEIAATADLQEWHSVSGGGGLGVRAIAHGSGAYVALGLDGRIYRSANLDDWDAIDSPASAPLRHLLYGGGRFVAAGDDANLLVSDDGRSWRRADAGLQPGLDGWELKWRDGMFLARFGGSLWLESADGEHWTELDWRRAAALFGNGVYVDTRRVDWWLGPFAPAALTMESQSAGGLLRESIDLTFYPELFSKDLCPCEIWRAASGTISTQPGTIGGTPADQRNDPTSITAIEWFDPSRFSSSPQGGATRFFFSTNGTDWTESTTVTGHWDATFAKGRFWAWRGSRMMSSVDGVTWETHSGNLAIEWMTSAGNTLVAQSRSGSRLYTSADGLTWTARCLTALSASRDAFSATTANGRLFIVTVLGDLYVSAPLSPSLIVRQGDDQAVTVSLASPAEGPVALEWSSGAGPGAEWKRVDSGDLNEGAVTIGRDAGGGAIFFRARLVE